jgi:SAM-dependent methyltransferase
MSSEAPGSSSDLLAEFGQIDIYVFDQLLRGQITSSMRILDAGCGSGRNSEYLMRCGAEIYGVDSDPSQVARIRDVASDAAPDLSPENFRIAWLDALPFPDAYFDAVICSAVLHFSKDTAEFENEVAEMWRVLRSGGIFFARLASTIGLEGRLTHLHDRWYRLPDGSDRFLVDADYLLFVSSRLGAELRDPLKTTVVQDMRSMTTWVLRKK